MLYIQDTQAGHESDRMETKWDFMNVRCITFREEWQSRHSYLSGYKLEPGRSTETAERERRGEPQTQ